MMCRLLVAVRELKHRSLLIEPSHERDSGGKVVGCKTCRHSDSRNENEKRIEMRHSFRVHKRRIYAVLDKRRLMLDGLLYDGIELVVCPDPPAGRHQLCL